MSIYSFTLFNIYARHTYIYIYNRTYIYIYMYKHKYQPNHAYLIANI